MTHDSDDERVTHTTTTMDKQCHVRATDGATEDSASY